MNDFRKAYGEWALVAGAAEGIGAAFSEALAKRGMNLLMVDFNAGALHGLVSDLGARFGVRTIPIHLDLEVQDAWRIILEEIEEKDCRLLIYNAAYSKVRPFLENTPQDLDRFVNINIATMVRLVHGVASRIRTRGGGGILLMSSLAGLIGPRYVAPYAATKAFALTLAEALFPEFREQGIRITACCAGTTATPTYLNSLPPDKGKKPRAMDPLQVADYALNNLGKYAICTPGWRNRLTYFFLLRILGRRMAAPMVSRFMQQMYPDIS